MNFTQRETVRPYGAHLTMSPWRALLVIIVPPVAMLASQIAMVLFVNQITGQRSLPDTLSPIQLLTINLSMSIAGVLTVPLVAYLANVPVRDILSYPRRFDLRRLSYYLLTALGLTLLSNIALGLLAPDQTPWIGFGVTGTTLVLVAIILLTTPLTAAAEEFMFRGATMPAAASFVKPARIGLILGVIVSSLAFALTHLASDPWILVYYLFLGLCTALMAIKSRGLEAPIAFHIANNTLTTLLNTFLADGGDFALYRSEGAGGPHLLLPALFVGSMVVVVWIREGSRQDSANKRPASHPS